MEARLADASRRAAIDPQDPRAKQEAQRLILRKGEGFELERETLPVWRYFYYPLTRSKAKSPLMCTYHIWVVDAFVGRELHCIDRLKAAESFLNQSAQGSLLCHHTGGANSFWLDRIDQAPMRMDPSQSPQSPNREWCYSVTPWAWMFDPREMQYPYIENGVFRPNRCLQCWFHLGRLFDKAIPSELKNADALRAHFEARHGVGGTERLIKIADTKRTK